MPSIVGENGPELFVPNSAGTVVPNGQFGGQNVQLTQVFNMQPGLPETVGAAIRSAAPRSPPLPMQVCFRRYKPEGAASIAVGRRS